MKKLAIVGASGHGKVVADLAEILGYQVFFFDDAFPNKKKLAHWDILGSFSDLLSDQKSYEGAVVAIGNNNIRNEFSNKLSLANFSLPVLIHPSSIVSKYADIKQGTVIFANTVINAFVQIGEYCIINTNAIVEHDCIIGNAVHLSPNVALAGATKVENFAWLGIGSVTRQLVTLGKNAIVGANSTVIHDVPANCTVVGSPAAVIKK